MRTVSDTDAPGQLAQILDGLDREPVAIRRDERDIAILLSASQYDRIMGRNAQALQQFCDEVGERARARGMTEEILESLLQEH